MGEHVHAAHLNEPVAGVDDLRARSARAWSGCRTRRRSAAACSSSSRRTTFFESPARGGSTTTTSGRGARLGSGRIASRTSPAKKWAFSISFSSRVRDRVRDRRLDDVDAEYLAGAQREREAERADAAVEVVDALGAASAGVLGREPVEPLGHLGVGLEEGLRRDAEAQAGELLLEALVARHAPSCSPPCETSATRRVRVQRTLASGSARASRPRGRRRGTRPRSSRAGPEARRCAGPRARRGCAGSPSLGAAVVGVEALGAAPVPDQVANGVASAPTRARSRARRRSGPSARGRGNRARASAVASSPERILHLVAVAPDAPSAAHERLQLEASSPPRRRSASPSSSCLCSTWSS